MGCAIQFSVRCSFCYIRHRSNSRDLSCGNWKIKWRHRLEIRDLRTTFHYSPDEFNYLEKFSPEEWNEECYNFWSKLSNEFICKITMTNIMRSWNNEIMVNWFFLNFRYDSFFRCTLCWLWPYSEHYCNIEQQLWSINKLHVCILNCGIFVEWNHSDG